MWLLVEDLNIEGLHRLMSKTEHRKHGMMGRRFPYGGLLIYRK